ncbi:FIST signal transduction protein [Pseudoduganella plicata]|uniref:FIST domain protein n=1 Tax=Pseudoduganella plicata TaxID=321984 RepID=A0A4P7BG95_9BURK|nr:FIST N-terminal domain-containing protein [Pseudoduganella plicata]QBQ37232.1 FIST domain protein [Pseudoduganella plicata]GGY98312.1 histidine kinase [Pseudoduganella plicata]
MANTIVAVSHTSLSVPEAAGRALAESLIDKLNGDHPDVLIVFASPEFDYQPLLCALDSACKPRLLVGCSSAGEFSGCATGNASVSVMAIRADDILFRAAIGTGLRNGTSSALKQVMPVFSGSEHPDFPYRSALVLTDALAGYVDEIIHEMMVLTGGTYQLFGGGAADDAKFHKTHVFIGTEAQTDAIVVLEMLSKKPIGLGVRHGWKPNGPALRVTEAQGTRLVSLNAAPAVEVFEEHALATGQSFDRADPLPFFLHNVIGIETGDGYKLRVPLTLNDDGSIACAAEVPVGATVHIMVADVASACEAARQASEAALEGLEGAEHAGSLLFDCAATRLRLGREFGNELETVAQALGSENFAGCNTYGQIARSAGQFSGFHNCTAIVCAIPL